jgi:hypothetical protein
LLKRCRHEAPPAIHTRFAGKPGQAMPAVGLQPPRQRPTRNLLLARQLRERHAIFEVTLQQLVTI